MKRKALFIIVIGCLVLAEPAWAKAWTVDQRQAQQMKDINAGQKSGQLTVKQSETLRKRLAHIARKKAKMRSKERGSLSTTDTAKLHDGFNKVSSNISKMKNEKRAHSNE